MIFWRNSNLNFSSPEKLIYSLELKPKNKILIKTQDAIDENVLRVFLKKGKNNNTYHKNLELLWECCQIPDFEKKAYGQHIQIIDKVFTFLTTRKNKIPNDYMKTQLSGLERDHGNVDVLSNRISNVRTWSYVANKKNWVENSDYWIQRTKNIEDKLSDKLHEELTRSFIDKKISLLSKSLKQDLVLNTKIDEKNKVIINGLLIGELRALKCNLEFSSNALDTDVKSLKKAARRGIKDELTSRVNEIINEKNIEIDNNLKILWKKNPIAFLKKGTNYLNPKLEIISDDSLDIDSKKRLTDFLVIWLGNYISEILGDLSNLIETRATNKYLRALTFRLFENNGVVKRSLVDDIVRKVSGEDRKKIWRMGIKIGRFHIYLPKMLKPKAVVFRIALWQLFNSNKKGNVIPKFGLNFLIDKKFDSKFMLLCGFEKFKNFYVRIDILEKLFIKILNKTKDRKFKVDTDMMNLLGCNKENFYELIKNMNYKKIEKQDTYKYMGDYKKKSGLSKVKDKYNPFNKLLELGIK